MSYDLVPTLTEPAANLPIESPTGAAMYTLRFPFRLPAGQAIGCDDRVFTIAGRQYQFKQSGNWYIATIEGFQTEAEANAYVVAVEAQLVWVQLHARLAPQVTLDVSRVALTEDPVAAAENLSRSFGIKIDPPVDGVADGSSPIIYATAKTIKVLTVGDASVTIATPLDTVVKHIQDFTTFAGAVEQLTDEKLRIALELYQAHFSEVSMNSKFLTLVMCLEDLATGEKRPRPVLDLLMRWEADVERLRTSLAGDAECVAALDSVSRELIFRRENSIRSQIRALVLNTFKAAGNADADAAARATVKLYDQRSTLVHEGRIGSAELSEAFESARSIAERVLRIRFKTAMSPNRQS